MTTSTQDTATSGALSPLKAVALGFAAMQVGPCLASVPTLLLQFGGAGSWISALMTLGVALLIGRAITTFASRYVVSGSLVSYAEIAFGNWGQRVVGVSLMLGYLGVIAMIVNDEIYYLTSLLSETGFPQATSLPWQCALSLFASAFSAFFAYRGPDLSARVAGLLALISLPVIMAVMLLAFSNHPAGFFDQFNTSKFDAGGILAGAVWGMAIYVGFDGLTSVASDTVNPRKNVPRILTYTLLLCGVTWSLGSLLQYSALAPHMNDILAGRTAISVLAAQAGLPGLTAEFDLVVGASVVASTIAFFNFAARIVATAAQDSMLPASLGIIDPESHAPRRAILLVGVIGAIVPMLIRLSGAESPIEAITTLASIVINFWLLPYFLISLGAILILRRESVASFAHLMPPAAGALLLILVVAQNFIAREGKWHMPVIAATILAVALGLLKLADRTRQSQDLRMHPSPE